MSDENSSPFEQPGLMTGYPLERDEERELENALREIEDERQEGRNGHQATATRATPASAS